MFIHSERSSKVVDISSRSQHENTEGGSSVPALETVQTDAEWEQFMASEKGLY